MMWGCYGSCTVYNAKQSHVYVCMHVGHVTSTVCTTEMTDSPTRIGPTDTNTEFELPTEPGTSGTSGNRAAVMNLSIEILLVMTAAVASLLLA